MPMRSTMAQPDGMRVTGAFGGKPILRILRQHLRLMLAVFVAVSLLGFGLLLLLKPTYTATATVAIAQASADPLSPTGQTPAAAQDDNLPSTEAAEIASRDVAAAVLAQIPPLPPQPGFNILDFNLPSLLCGVKISYFCAAPAATDPASRAQAQIDTFLKSLSVLPELHSSVIDVSVTAPNGPRAAALADAVVEAYQRIALAGQTQDVNRVAAWLDARTAQLRQNWLDAVTAANAYSVSHGLTNAQQGGGSTPLVDSQIANMAASLGNAQASLAAAQARAAGLTDASQHGDPNALLTLPEQPILVAAAAQLMQLESQRDQLASEFGPNYPKIRSLDGQIAQTRAIMNGQTGSAFASITETKIAEQAEVNQLAANLSQLKAQAAAQSAEQAQYTSLNDEAASARSVYETFLEDENAVVDRAALLEPPVTFVSHAGIPLRATFPNKTKLGLAILLLALVAGGAAAFIRDYFSEGFAQADDLRATVDEPLLAALPLLVGARDDEISRHVLDAPFSRTGEAVRGLAAKLSLLAPDETAPRAILVSSAGAIEGKTTLALWLALAMHQGGHAVLVIDGDHRRSSLMRHAALASKPGLTDYIAGDAAAPDLIQQDPSTGIDFIASGNAMSRAFGPSEIARLRALIDTMKQRYQMIIIDSPPLLAMTDGFVHGSIADQTVFVCRWQRTSRQAVLASLDRLRDYGANVAGVVVTMVDQNSALQFDGDYGRRERQLISRLYGS